MANVKNLKGQTINVSNITNGVNSKKKTKNYGNGLGLNGKKFNFKNNNHYGKKIFKKTYQPTDKDVEFFKIGENIVGSNMNLTESEELNAKTIDLFAPLRDFKQITSIVGAAGCGKTTSIKNLLKFYSEYYDIKNVAVISINERADEADVWKEVDLKHLYCVSSNDSTYSASEKIEILKSIINKVNSDNTIELVVLDSITGWYELIVESGKEATQGFGDGGYRQDIFNDIWKIVSNIKAEYLLCSIIQNPSIKAYTTLNHAFNSKADSTIYLEADLTRMEIYNNVNPYKSFTRRAVYEPLRRDAIKILNAFGGSFRAMIELGAIDEDDYGKDFIYPFN